MPRRGAKDDTSLAAFADLSARDPEGLSVYVISI
jgi:hypothetical protein